MQRNDTLGCGAKNVSVGNEASPQHSSLNQKQTQLICEEWKFHQTGLTAGVGPTEEEDKEEESLAALPGFNDLAP